MRRILLLPALLLLAACPSEPAAPLAGVDLVGPAKAWARAADADWADLAAAEIIRLGRLTPENVLDLMPSKAEGVCRILAHLDEAGARTLLLEMLDHPDANSGFYGPFLLPAATIAWTRALGTGQVDSLAPLEEKLAKRAREMKDYRWFSVLADSVEAAGSRATLPALLDTVKRIGAESEEARSILAGRVIRAHDVLADPGAVPLAREILSGKPRFESGDALLYLDRHDPEAALVFARKILTGNGPQAAVLHVIYRRGGPSTDAEREAAERVLAELPEEKRRFFDWYGRPPAWEPPPEQRDDPAVARFLIRNGIGNRMTYLGLWIQPPLSHSQPRWFAEEADALAQLAALQALFAAPLPSIWNQRGEADPWGVFPERLRTWWEEAGHRLTWKRDRNVYAP